MPSIVYGQGLADQTLRYLSTVEDPLYRLVKGHSEMSIMKDGDTKPELFKELRVWKTKYVTSKLGKLKYFSDANSSERLLVSNLLEELTNICIEIIEHNAIERHNKGL